MTMAFEDWTLYDSEDEDETEKNEILIDYSDDEEDNDILIDEASENYDHMDFEELMLFN